MLTKTQEKIMQVFVSQITELFSIRSIERILKINYSLVHRAIKPLIEEYNLLKINKQKYISLNFKDNHDVLAYIEYERRNNFLKKPGNIDLAMCLKDFVTRFKEESFVLLIFGSAVNKINPGDIDILLIVDNIDKADSSEAFLHNISRNYELAKKLHIVCISYESVYEMLASREQRNIINEVLNKHIIIHGAELFFRLLNKGRK
ncbi:hypothetical protein HYX16_00415 [Candidatus Woesearchaeota archaeon]|nr:hypothetical protein [Candidatus Woesearchaeota archaeon]